MKHRSLWHLMPLLVAAIGLSPQIATASHPCNNIASRTAEAKRLFQADEFVKTALIAERIYKCPGHETRLYLAAMARQHEGHCEIAVQHYTYLLNLQGLKAVQKKKLKAGLRDSRNACDQLEVTMVLDESRVERINAPDMPHYTLRFEHRTQPHRIYEVEVAYEHQNVLLGAGDWVASMTFDSAPGRGYRNWEKQLTTEINVVGDLEITLIPQCSKQLDCPRTARTLPHCGGRKCPPKRPTPVVAEPSTRPTAPTAQPERRMRIRAQPNRTTDYWVFSSLAGAGAIAGTVGLLVASSANKEIKLLNETPMASANFTSQINEQLLRRQYAYGSLGTGVGLLLSSGAGWATARNKRTEKWWLAGEIVTGAATLTVGALMLYDVNSAIDDFNGVAATGFPGGAKGYWKDSQPVHQRASSAAFLLGTGTALATSGISKWLWRYLTDTKNGSSEANASMQVVPGGASVSIGSQF